MADKPPTLPPASDPFPGSRTPGWNDPPTLQYNPLAAPAAASGGRPRLNLNKRVAFPLQGMGGIAGATTGAAKPTAIVQPNQSAMPPPPSMSLPSQGTGNSNQPIAVVHPMPNMNAPPTAARVPPTGVENTRTIGGTSVALPIDAEEMTFRILREQTGQVQESLNVRREEIERRLGLIEQLWQSRNLSSPVQQKIYRLAKAIADKSFTEAMDTYTSLVVNHSNDCATWAVALRHIVLTLQPPPSTVETDATTTIENNIAAVPPMFVPAMSRVTSSSNEMSAAIHTQAETNAASVSRVQHI